MTTQAHGTDWVHLFTGTDEPTLSQVGGKGFSLIRTARAGLPVPPGFVLDVAFFVPWLAQLRTTPAWRDFLAAARSHEGLERSCRALKDECRLLALSAEQERALQGALASTSAETLFAVRSSSPEEDMEGASFAGGYETVLGVTRERMADAVRRAFASCLDFRIAVYKREHGFDVSTPTIAVVIQQQIASEVAGVGFSINPLDNSYDEAVFNANWGLGETVVSGLASPDTYVVDRVGNTVVETHVGSKETSVFLTAGGGTEERPDPRRDQPCLTEAQVLELARLIDDVERLYARPMDIEWAFAGGRLYLLQARPVTTVVPLPEAMVTAPGQRPRLYLDVTISVQGLFKPMSVMGTSFLQHLISAVCLEVFGKDVSQRPETAVFFALEGRLYMNLSAVFALAGRDRFARNFALMDPVAAATVAGIDEARYRSDSADIAHLPLHALNNLPDKALQIVEARLLPQQALRACRREMDRYAAHLRSLQAEAPPLADLLPDLFGSVAHLLFTQIVPLFLTARTAQVLLGGMFGEEEASLLHALDRSLPGNITIEMGLELYEAATLLPADITLETLDGGLRDRTLPRPFLSAWDAFLERYGHRGPMELDIRTPRYRDQPHLLMQQMVAMRAAVDTDEKTPLARYEEGQRERHDASEALAERAAAAGWVKGRRFQSLYRVFETLGGMRESGKYYAILALDVLRRRLLQEGERWAAAGRLDARDDVFDLTLEDMLGAQSDPTLDLRARARERTAFPDRLARLAELPLIIDSRGRILRAPPRPAREGEVGGMAISAGVVRGPVKTLHAPDEKPVNRGDVLVARATDPGWTPLFVNACAVVLEVGGMLQHGALVAREYGKPCVAGIARVTELWADGTWVEVDGTAGIVRIVEPPSVPPPGK